MKERIAEKRLAEAADEIRRKLCSCQIDIANRVESLRLWKGMAPSRALVDFDSLPGGSGQSSLTEGNFSRGDVDANKTTRPQVALTAVCEVD